MIVKPLLSAVSGRPASRRLLILTYHRVRAEHDLVWRWDPICTEFEQQMRLVRKYFNVFTVTEAIEMIGARKLVDRAICITFDDGYADNFEVAFPILKTLGIKATFYIATGYLNGKVMWNDRVLDVYRALSPGQYDFGELGVVHFRDDAAKAQAASDTLKRLKYLPAEERDQVAADVASRFGVESSVSTMMSDKMVEEMHRDGMEIGAHTVSHPILSSLSRSVAQSEIEGSKSYLESLLGTEVRSFAYPNGKSEQDLTARDIDLVRDAGFTTAVTTDWGPVLKDSDPMALPRVGIYGTNPAKLVLKLCQAFRS